MEHNHIDKVFKNAADNASFSPPEGLWNNIAQQLPSSNPIVNPPANNFINGLSNLSTLVKVVIVATTVAAVSIPIIVTNQTNSQNKVTEKVTQNELNIEQDETTEIVIKDIQKNTEEEIPEKIGSDFSKVESQKIKPESFIVPKLTIDVVASSSSLGTLPTQELLPNEIKNNGSQIEATSSIENHKNSINLGDTFVCGPEQSLPIYSILRTNNKNKIFIDYNDSLYLIEELTPYSMNYVFRITKGEGTQNKLVKEVLEQEGKVRLVSQNELQNSITQRRVLYKNLKKAEILANDLNNNDLLVELYTTQVVKEISWYLNDEFYNENMKQFVYNRNLELSQPTTLKIKAVYTTQHGCLDSAENILNSSLSFVKEPECANVFTPNGDGKNDFWFVQIQGEERFNLRVFDIFQNLLFETTNKEDKWDGKDRHGNILEAGTYYFQLNYKMPTKENKQKTGHIVLIR